MNGKSKSLQKNKAKRHIYANAQAGNGGGPVVDVKAWKAAKKAAASSKADDQGNEQGYEQGYKQGEIGCERVSKGSVGSRAKDGLGSGAKGLVAAAVTNCDMDRVNFDTKGDILKVGQTDSAAVTSCDTKDHVNFDSKCDIDEVGQADSTAVTNCDTKDHVNFDSKGDIVEVGCSANIFTPAGSSGMAGKSKLPAAVPKGIYTEITPELLLTQFCEKKHLKRPIFESIQQKGGRGFKGKMILNSKEPNGEQKCCITRECYQTAHEAKQWAAVMALYVVAGDRRMDRMLPLAYQERWKQLEEEEIIHKRNAEATAAKREAKAKQERRYEDMDKLHISEELHTLIEEALREFGDEPCDNDTPQEQQNTKNAIDQRSSIVDSEVTARFTRIQGKVALQRTAPMRAEVLEGQERLPAQVALGDILAVLRGTRALVVSGAAGCGKSTQVPQTILDEAIECGDGGQCRIVCTQPFCVAAVRVAECVAQDRGEAVGGTVGYQVRTKANMSAETRLLFCTNEILLQMLRDDPDLMGVSHVVVDEVHQRSIHCDFLLILLRRLMERRMDLKLVLMSATADNGKLSSYLGGAPCLDMPSFPHPVRQMHLEDVLAITGTLIGRGYPYALPKEAFLARKQAAADAIGSPTTAAPGATPPLQDSEGSDGTGEEEEKDTLATTGFEDADSLDSVVSDWEITSRGDDDDDDDAIPVSEKTPLGRALTSVDVSMRNVDETKVNYHLLELLLAHIIESKDYEPVDSGGNGILGDVRGLEGPPGGVLIFLPGMEEIQKAYNHLKKSRRLLAGALNLLQLDPSLPLEEQRKVFQRSQTNTMRKVVLATKVAETSVTIDNIVYVIDTGRCTETTCDPDTGLSRLDDAWVSVAAACMRSGCAGSNRPGVCFRLFSHRTLASMAPQQIPEMNRVPLDQLCLQVLSMGLGPVHKLLEQALDPPSQQAVEKAIATLCAIGAIRAGVRGRWFDCGSAGKHNSSSAATGGGGEGSVSDAAAAARTTAPTTSSALATGGSWELTVLGRHLSRISLDSRLARMLLFGAVFGCLDPVLTIAATMSFRSPFVCPITMRDAANCAKRRFADDCDWSDYLAFARAYDAWLDTRGGCRRAESAFFEANFLSAASLRIIRGLRQKFADVLSDAGIVTLPRRVDHRGGGHVGESAGIEAVDPHNTNSGNSYLIRAVICAGLFPNVVQVRLPDARFLDTFAGAITMDLTARQLRMFTQQDGRVFLHPGSLNFHQARFPSHWLVYQRKRVTSKVFVQDSTMVTPYALLLFGEDMRIDSSRGVVRVGCGGWIRFAGSGKDMALMQRLRAVLEAVLELKLKRPAADLSDHPALKALLLLLASEH